MKKYIISITNFMNFLVFQIIPNGIDKENLIRYKLVLQNCCIKRNNKKELHRKEVRAKNFF